MSFVRILERKVVLKKILAAIMAAASILALSGCKKSEPQPENGMASYDFKEMDTDYIQLKPPKAGDKIAIIDTDYGEIRVALYEQYAPNTVRNFIEKANAGVYNDMPVKGVSENMYFLTGGKEDKKGRYVGRDSDDELIENEYSVNLWPFSGALVSWSEKAGKSDARWFMINNNAESLTEEAIVELKDSAKDMEDEVVREKVTAMFDKFYEVGGVFDIAGENTVFGQTYLGMDVVERLTNIPANEDGDATEVVMIKSVTISEFKDGDKTDEYPRKPLHDKVAGSGSDNSGGSAGESKGAEQ